MKNGRQLVWSMWEWLSTIECTPTWRSIDSAWESDPASSATLPLMSRQVIRHSGLSPPNAPRTSTCIYTPDCIFSDAEPPHGKGALAALPGGPVWPRLPPQPPALLWIRVELESPGAAGPHEQPLGVAGSEPHARRVAIEQATATTQQACEGGRWPLGVEGETLSLRRPGRADLLPLG